MKPGFLLLFLAASASLAGYSSSDGDWLMYDDGTPQWIAWHGIHKGTWFNLHDFIPGMNGGWIDQTRIWFYHHSSHPWDTSDFYAEIWNGTKSKPQTRLYSVPATATHFAPVYISEWALVEQHFWVIVNTGLSTGGWPSLLSDGMNPASPTFYHSFYSYDFNTWTPWDINGACYYFVAAELSPDPPPALERVSWAAVKAVF